MNDPCADHEVLSRWSYDPLTLVYSKRCARCGAVVARVSSASWDRRRSVATRSTESPDMS